MKTLKMTHYSDSGHGWIAVKRSLLVQFGLLNKISAYSYQSKAGTTVYLEEDGDAPILINTLRAHGIAYQLDTKYKDGSSLIRSYPRYQAVQNGTI